MRNNKLLTCVMAGTLALATLSGCAGNPVADQPADDASTQEGASDAEKEGTEKLAGGWSVNDETKTSLTDEELSLFEKASADYKGEELTPKAILATQVVAGTNYAYLCNSGDSWAVAVVYEDLQGVASITGVTDIDVSDVKVGDESTGRSLSGGWEIRHLDAGATLPKDAGKAFDKACDGYAGISLTPVALLGTQVVAGTNYLVICEGVPAIENSQDTLYIAKIEADLDGNAQLASVLPFDLIAYV